jgi:hypothetical protein
MESEKILEIINSYNKFWAYGTIEAGIKRDVLSLCLRQLESKEILLIKGVRRSGKSTLMAQMILSLLEKGTKPGQILRVNLEEPLFGIDSSIDLLEHIYRVYRDHVNPSGKCYLFLDEVQNIPEWERWVRGRSETENIKMVITGSSSRLLSRETGTKLTGRHVSFEIFPLSFSEFLRFKNISLKSKSEYYAQKSVVRNFFTDFLKYGGFPEVVLKQDPEDKELLLKQYFEDILYRDIVSRYEIRDVVTLKNLAVFLLTNIGRFTSVSSLKKNFQISQDKVENYTSAIFETYLLSRLAKFSFSAKKSMQARFKPYAVDTGLRNRVAFSFSEDMGWLAENVAMNHLKGRFEEVFYDADGGEVDFVVKQGTKVTMCAQVWYADPAETTIPERELYRFVQKGSPLEKAEKLILTNDLEGTRKAGEGTARCLPLTLFLLDLF